MFSRIFRRIILIMVILSGAVTLAMTITQTFIDYNRDFNNGRVRHDEIQTIHAELLASSLWNYDLVVLTQRLEGLVNLPNVVYMKITSGDYHFSAGEPVTSMALNSEIALEYTNPDTQVTENIGTLYVESDAQGIYNYLIQQFLLTLAVNALKTAIVCYLILMIFHASVNQRILRLRNFYVATIPDTVKPLQLPFNPWIMEKMMSYNGWERKPIGLLTT